MSIYWRAKWTVRRVGYSGYRILRRGLRAVTPFSLRQRIPNLMHGKEAAEVPVADSPLPPSSGYDIICFPIIDWDFRFQRPQQLLTEFARERHRVFYLHTTFHQSNSSPLIRRMAENIYRVRLPGPAGLNVVYQSEIGRQTIETLIGALDELRSQAEIKAAVSFVQFPFWTSSALATKERWGWKIVYDCMDEHSGFSNNPEHLLRNEEELIAGSDLVVTTSRLLHEKASRAARQTLLLPNAADFDHFSHPGPSRALAGLGSPIVGYYGAISEWFDVEMIRASASARPYWQFVLIGEIKRADVSSLKRLGNVHFLGELPYSVLPSFLHQFDVASIPFLINPLTRATNPVKFYEYLSAGKPIVSAPLPELEPYREYFYPAHSAEQFVSQVEAALKEQSPEKVRARIEFARQNTWRDRYETLSSRLASLFT